jgi:hypothetical protein
VETGALLAGGINGTDWLALPPVRVTTSVVPAADGFVVETVTAMMAANGDREVLRSTLGEELKRRGMHKKEERNAAILAAARANKIVLGGVHPEFWVRLPAAGSSGDTSDYAFLLFQPSKFFDRLRMQTTPHCSPALSFCQYFSMKRGMQSAYRCLLVPPASSSVGEVPSANAAAAPVLETSRDTAQIVVEIVREMPGTDGAGQGVSCSAVGNTLKSHGMMDKKERARAIQAAVDLGLLVRGGQGPNSWVSVPAAAAAAASPSRALSATQTVLVCPSWFRMREIH